MSSVLWSAVLAGDADATPMEDIMPLEAFQLYCHVDAKALAFLAKGTLGAGAQSADS